jgi:TRAP-type mannitol/chloroaromatic compound transport system permease large subunit
MHWSKWIRQSHRWLAIVFMAAVIAATFAAVGGQAADSWLYYLPLPPLFLMMLSGLYLFLLPYATKWLGQRTGEEA